VALVNERLEQDNRLTCEELTELSGISASTVHRILTEQLHKRKMAAKWIPHLLTAEQLASSFKPELKHQSAE
jgi:hypothetical protein